MHTRVYAGDVCRLHSLGRCSWGIECRRLHVCREFLRCDAGGLWRQPSDGWDAINEPRDEEGLSDDVSSSASSAALRDVADALLLENELPPGSRLHHYHRCGLATQLALGVAASVDGELGTAVGATPRRLGEA